MMKHTKTSQTQCETWYDGYVDGQDRPLITIDVRSIRIKATNTIVHSYAAVCVSQFNSKSSIIGNNLVDSISTYRN